MKSAVLIIVMTLFAASAALAANMNDPKEYKEIIENRCTKCHTQERIEAAIKEGRDMNQILNKMIKMGATLSDREKEVLGTFWGSPMKEK